MSYGFSNFSSTALGDFVPRVFRFAVKQPARDECRPSSLRSNLRSYLSLPCLPMKPIATALKPASAALILRNFARLYAIINSFSLRIASWTFSCANFVIIFKVLLSAVPNIYFIGEASAENYGLFGIARASRECIFLRTLRVHVVSAPVNFSIRTSTVPLADRLADHIIQFKRCLVAFQTADSRLGQSARRFPFRP